MTNEQLEYINASKQALAQHGDPSGQGLVAVSEIEQAPEDSWFDTAINVAVQLPMGFYEGYTTFDGGAAPTSKTAEIVRSIGNLWGFIGFIPDPTDFVAAPAKAALRYGTKNMKAVAANRIVAKGLVKAERGALGDVGKKLLEQKAAGLLEHGSAGMINAAESIAGMNGYGQALRGVLGGKSIPMLAANVATKGVGTLLKTPVMANGARAATALLSGTKAFKNIEAAGIMSDAAWGALHLGVASGVSGLGINPMAWGDRVDRGVSGLAGGSVMGGAFGLLGNIGRVSSKLILDGKQSSAEHLLRTVAGSLMTGLPSTLQNRDTADQVYEYLLGGYFGFHATPWVVSQGKAQADAAFKANKDAARIYLDAKDYGRFASVTGATALHARNAAAGDIMFRESLILHGIPQAEASAIMRNPDKYNKRPFDPLPMYEVPSNSKEFNDAELIRATDAAVSESRAAWDKQYSDVIDQQNEWRAAWGTDPRSLESVTRFNEKKSNDKSVDEAATALAGKSPIDLMDITINRIIEEAPDRTTEHGRALSGVALKWEQLKKLGLAAQENYVRREIETLGESSLVAREILKRFNEDNNASLNMRQFRGIVRSVGNSPLRDVKTEAYVRGARERAALTREELLSNYEDY